MAKSYTLEPVLRFLTGLSRHNEKAWFDAHRDDYTAARAIFEQFLEDLIDELRPSDRLEDLSARQCMFRINRDVRFSKDKSPYKTNMSAVIARGGRTSSHHGYYISVEPSGKSMAAGGLYMPSPTQLAAFRRAIDGDAAAFRRLVAAKPFKTAFGTVAGNALKTAPKGYDASHPDIDLLRLTQVTAVHRFTDEEVRAPGFPRKVLSVFRAMRPFLDYLNGI